MTGRPRGAFSLAVQRAFADLERPAHFRDIVAELVRVGVLAEPVAPAEVKMVREAINEGRRRGDLIPVGTAPAQFRPMTVYRLRGADEPRPQASHAHAERDARVREVTRALLDAWK